MAAARAAARRGCPPRRSGPCRSTMMRSACSIVDSRCAMTMRGAVVQHDGRGPPGSAPRSAGRRWRWPRPGRRSPGPGAAARASATSWRWPIERAAAVLADRRCRRPSGSASSQSPPPTAAAAASTSVVARLRPRVADVVGDRAGEQERRLRHDAELPPVRRPGRSVRMSRPSISSCAALELVEARDQLAERRLARRRCGRRARPSRPRAMVRLKRRSTLLAGRCSRSRRRGTRCGRASRGDRLAVGLHDRAGSRRSARRRARDAARPCWNWLQNEAMLVSGNQKSATPAGRGTSRRPRRRRPSTAACRRSRRQRPCPARRR